MAHTTRIGNTEFIHNGDFKGDVEIWAEGNPGPLKVPFEDLMAFVAERIRARKIEQLEVANINSILGL